MLTMGQHQGFWAKHRSVLVYESMERSFSTSETTTCSISAPASIGEGDLLLACLIHEGAGQTPACSGWSVGRRDTTNGLNASVLYKWATGSEGSSYSFTHTDTSYGGFGGAVLRFTGSIKKGHYPIYAISDVTQTSFYGNEEKTWITANVNVPIAGSIALAFGAARRVPQTGAMGCEVAAAAWTDLTNDGVLFIGGYGSGNCVGGGLGVQKFTTPNVAYDAGGILVGESGSLGSLYTTSRTYVLI